MSSIGLLAAHSFTVFIRVVWQGWEEREKKGINRFALVCFKGVVLLLHLYKHFSPASIPSPFPLYTYLGGFDRWRFSPNSIMSLLVFFV